MVARDDIATYCKGICSDDYGRTNDHQGSLLRAHSWPGACLTIHGNDGAHRAGCLALTVSESGDRGFFLVAADAEPGAVNRRPRGSARSHFSLTPAPND